ncbi:MAG: hypothetical protein RIQ89_1924 [Bacteroidota bacterium]|jgi:lycopene beta-cyclase
MDSANQHFDIAITGGGAAGLSLAMHLIHAGLDKKWKVVIIDKDSKESNDRTWCFWEKEKGLFDAIIYKKWSHLIFNHPIERLHLDISPYTYKMLRGIDFYSHCKEAIHNSSITWMKANIRNILNENGKVSIETDQDKFTASKVFDSTRKVPLVQPPHYHLLQHFKGIIIETQEASFNPEAATFMDFDTNQNNDTRFIYLLPFSKTKALVEYTIFSEQLLDKQAYSAALNNYLTAQGISQYKLIEEEFGVIPMTDYYFEKQQGAITYIGTAGGLTKASSGYTFGFIQKNCKHIIDQLLDKPNAVRESQARFNFYDSVLLGLLTRKELPARDIFYKLFSKNPPSTVLSFLNNETTLLQEMSLFFRLPIIPFAKSALRELLNGKAFKT